MGELLELLSKDGIAHSLSPPQTERGVCSVFFGAAGHRFLRTQTGVELDGLMPVREHCLRIG